MDFDSKFNYMLKKEYAVYIGFYVVASLAVLGWVFQLIRGFNDMEASWAVSTGIEALGLAMNAIVFLGFLSNKENGTKIRSVFAALILTSSLGLFWDECAWLVQGVANYSVLNRISNSLLYINSFTMELMFWAYVINIFKIPYSQS